MQTTHTLDEKSKEKIEIKISGKREILEEKPVSEIKPTEIFSFSDYEKLKEELNKKK
jgi:hypothetical protein